MHGSMARRGLALGGPGRRVQPIPIPIPPLLLWGALRPMVSGALVGVRTRGTVPRGTLTCEKKYAFMLSFKGCCSNILRKIPCLMYTLIFEFLSDDLLG